LAYAETGQSHSNFSFYSNRLVFKDLPDGNYYRVPGNVLKEVLAEEKLNTYLEGFKRIVEQFPQIEFINTSLQGAAIEGAPYMDFITAGEWIGDQVVGGIDAKLKDLCKPLYGKEELTLNLKKAFEPMRGFLEKLIEICKEAISCIEKLPRTYEGRIYAKEPGIIRASGYSHKVNELLDRNPEEMKVLCEGRAKLELYRYMEFCKTNSISNEHWRVLMENEVFYKALLNGALSLEENFKKLDI